MIENNLEVIMKKILILVILTILLFGCGQKNEATNGSKSEPEVSPPTTEKEMVIEEEEIEQVEVTTETKETEETTDTAENTDSLIFLKDNIIYLKGITLGMSSEEVLTILGEPLFNGPDPEDAYYDTITEYDDISIGYYGDQASSIYFNGPLNLEETLHEFEGQKYKYEDDNTYFLYSPEGQMLLKISSNGETYDTYLLYEDENFHFSLDNGMFIPVE